MKLDYEKFGSEVETTVENNIGFGISDNSDAIIFDMFTEKMYSNPIGSIVREITSNAVDSHIEANVNDPVVIRLTNDVDTNTTHISFIDVGVGMSPERIKEVYSVYFNSTKRDTNNQIGGWGLGGKTPLAYKRYIDNTDEYDNSFHVITTHNGIKYHYVVHEGEKSPEISLLFREKSINHNGTEVKIEVNASDLDAFIKELKYQLVYFDNILFEGFNDYEELNDYKIYHGNYFSYRENSITSYAHINLGGVFYPIDYNVLDLNSSHFYTSIGVKFDIGEIEVIPSRESIKYSKKTIKVIKDRINSAMNELKDLFLKQNSKIESLLDYYKNANYNSRFYIDEETYIDIPENNKVFENIDYVLPNFRYNGIILPQRGSLFFEFFNIKLYGTDKTVRNRFDRSAILNATNLQDNDNLYFVDGDFKRNNKKQRYLNSKHDRFYIISPNKDFLKHKHSSIVRINSKNDVLDKTKENLIIELFKEYVAFVSEVLPHYENVEIPSDFKPVNNTKEKVDLSNVYLKTRLVGGHYRNIPLKTLSNFNGVVFYGFREDSDTMNSARNVLNVLFKNQSVYYVSHYGEFRVDGSSSNLLNRILLITIAKKDTKYMQHLKKAYHIDYFYHKLLYRKKDMIDSFFSAEELINRYRDIKTLYKAPNFSNINPKIGNLMNEISKEYFDKIRNIPNLGYIEYEIKSFYTPNINETNKGLMEKMDIVLCNQEKNKSILSYISTGYYDELDETQIDILKKVMLF